MMEFWGQAKDQNELSARLLSGVNPSVEPRIDTPWVIVGAVTGILVRLMRLAGRKRLRGFLGAMGRTLW